MTVTEAKEKLMKLQSRLSAYNHAQELMFYDEATIAPEKTDENRAHALSVLSEESYIISTGPETVELLEFLDAHKDELNLKEQRMVFLMLKEIRRMQAIPMDEYVAFQELLGTAYGLWRGCKINSDFEGFRPTLEKIFATNIKFAKYCAPDMHPYDYWLGEFEEGLTMEKCDEFFGALKERIIPLIQKIGEAEQVDDSCLKGNFPEAKQAELSDYLMRLMQVDLGHCNLMTTEHPFTTAIGSHKDVRITTHYLEEDFSSSMFSVIHESGHALYDMASEDDLAYTVLDGGVSMGIHESQSRFYENIIGRSRNFIKFVYPKVKELFPEAMEGTDEEGFYKAINKVEPSLIRTEADEVTYCLHVMIRYELEKKVMSGEMTVAELPEAWNALYKEYLGVDVPDDRHGVLQDSHWSGGTIGYFPSYALGSAYGAEFIQKMREDVDVDAALAEGNFAPLNEWNKEHIWKYGHLYTPQEVLDRVLGKPFSPEAYIEYLEKKYTDIYFG